jgi:hypothetical protein
MKPSSQLKLLWIAIAASSLALTSCGGCGGKKRSDKSTKGGAEKPVDEPKDDPKKDEEPKKDVTDVGEEVPPITPDKVATIDTSKGAALKHLILKTTDEQEAGRYLSEFLMVIRANEDSCVRLKVRPTSGITSEIDDAAFQAEIEGSGACEGQKIGGDAAPAEEEQEEEAADDEEEEGAGLWMANLVDPGAPNALKRSVGFDLTAPNLPVCSSRVFRMLGQDVGEGQGLEAVVTKTGRLAIKGTKVRIWLDEEYANICTGGSDLNSRAPTAFAALEQMGALPSQVLDKLWQAHLTNLVNEMDKIVTGITTNYGDVSDIDQSGFVEIFMSPDVNRRYFNNHESHYIDHFRAEMVYRPEDLAYYNAETNPTSNEGEILYLWTPDPAGIYNYVQFPSADSITSNYAKGYLAAQVATLVVANQKLFVHKLKGMEERWVVEALASLLSAYYAGNDFTYPYLIQYLTSRPQYLSLSGEPKADYFSEKFLPLAHDEQTGLRAMFGWYMHSRLCGASVTPCAKLKELVTSKELGKKNVEAVLGLKFDQLLENFGLSVGVELLDRPSEALKFWDKNPLPADYPPAPIELPNLTQVLQSAPRVTEEANDSAVLLGGSKVDRTVAGPFPSKDMLIFQPVASDNELEFKMAKDSVAYLLVTGLVDQQTDLTAVFGKGLNVVFVPAGERDTSKRRLHVEKLSEQAHSDLRPENLTAASDADTTYAYEPVYEDLDYSVTGTRELWILGSTDNFSINQQGTEAQIGDTDAYNVHIKPCAHLSGAAKTTCEASPQTVIAQVTIRDFEKELAPMLVVTSPDRKLFRGHSIYGRLSEIDAEYEEPTEQSLGALCQAASSWPTATVTFTAGAPGLVNYAAHGLAPGATVYFSETSGTTSPIPKLPIGLSPMRPYTVVANDANSFSLSSGGQPVSIGHSGQIMIRDVGDDTEHEVTFTPGSPGQFTITGAHTLANNDVIKFFGDDYTALLPEGVDPDPSTDYYARNVVGNVFEISLTSGGVSINLPVTVAGTFSVHTGSATQCANGGFANATVFNDQMTRQDDTAYAATYDNFVMMGRLGYPYTNQNALSWLDMEECPGFRCYMQAESDRQHLKAEISKDEKARHYTYFTAPRGLDTDDTTVLDGEAVATLAMIKSRIDTCDSPDPQSDEFVAQCTGVAELTENQCKNLCGSGGLSAESRIKSYLSSERMAMLCRNGGDCSDHYTLLSAGGVTDPWMPLSRFYWYGSSGQSLTSFYRAVEPEEKEGYCAGEPNADATGLFSCDVKIEDMGDVTDLRHQINTSTGRFKSAGNCTGSVLTTDFDACLDGLSWLREVSPDEGYAYEHVGETLATDRVRNRAMPIAFRAGELVAKPERLHAVRFLVPGTGGVANLIVGGRDKSQGKYLLRVRVKDFAD